MAGRQSAIDLTISQTLYTQTHQIVRMHTHTHLPQAPGPLLHIGSGCVDVVLNAVNLLLLGLMHRGYTHTNTLAAAHSHRVIQKCEQQQGPIQFNASSERSGINLCVRLY